MSSRPLVHRRAPAASTKANARALATLQNSPRVRPTVDLDPAAAPRRDKEPPGPLWVIAIAMGAFFGATALIMMFD